MPDNRRDRRKRRRRQGRSVVASENIAPAPEPDEPLLQHSDEELKQFVEKTDIILNNMSDKIEGIGEIAEEIINTLGGDDPLEVSPEAAEEIAKALDGAPEIETVLEVDLNDVAIPESNGCQYDEDIKIPGPAEVPEQVMAAMENAISGDGISHVSDVDLHDPLLKKIQVAVLDTGKEPDVVKDPPADSSGHPISPNILSRSERRQAGKARREQRKAGKTQPAGTDLEAEESADRMSIRLKEKAEEQQKKIAEIQKAAATVEYTVKVPAAMIPLLETVLKRTARVGSSYGSIEDFLSTILKKGIRDLEKTQRDVINSDTVQK